MSFITPYAARQCSNFSKKRSVAEKYGRLRHCNSTRSITYRQSTSIDTKKPRVTGQKSSRKVNCLSVACIATTSSAAQMRVLMSFLKRIGYIYFFSLAILLLMHKFSIAKLGIPCFYTFLSQTF